MWYIGVTSRLISNLSLFRRYPCIRGFVVVRNMSSVETAKRNAATKAVDLHIKNNDVIGVGSGTTMVYAVERLAERVKQEKLNVICIPSSFQAHQLIVEFNLNLGILDKNFELDVVIDGADEVDSNLNLIKGGGGCMLQEKILASCTNNYIIIADYNKKSQNLGDKWKKGIPIEVVPMAYIPVIKNVTKVLGGTADLRIAKMKVGPVITDNGNFLIDWKFEENNAYDWEKVNHDLKMLSGVVETGLFINIAKKAYFGMENGTVEEM